MNKGPSLIAPFLSLGLIGYFWALSLIPGAVLKYGLGVSAVALVFAAFFFGKHIGRRELYAQLDEEGE